MVVINEINRPQKKFDIKYLGNNGKAYNSDKEESRSCTWNCHNHGCDSKHFSKMSVLNNQIIYWMNSEIKKFNKIGSGDYSSMNIATLVIIWPLLMFALLVMNIELFIRHRKNRLKARV
jgi:hypothetical protein